MSTKEKKDVGPAAVQKRCFVITPIGTPGTEVNRAAMGLLAAVIKPVFTSRSFLTQGAHEITATGSINKQIVTELLTADFCVANLTGLNPNVMYELAIRHAAKKPLVCMADIDTKLPFDIVDERTIFYTNDMADVEDTKSRLGLMVDAIIEEGNGFKPDNPITRASTIFEIDAEVTKVGSGEAILARLDQLERVLRPSGNDHPFETCTTFVITPVPGTSIDFVKLTSRIQDELRSLPREYIVRYHKTMLVVTPALPQIWAGYIQTTITGMGCNVTVDSWTPTKA